MPRRLIELSQPIDQIESTLAAFPRDFGYDLVLLELKQVRAILLRLVDGNISEDVVERWANAIECREDIGFVPGTEIAVRELNSRTGEP